MKLAIQFGFCFAALICAEIKLPAFQAGMLPNGWRITPVGRHILLKGDFPSRLLLTPDGSRLLVLTSGFHHQSVEVIDPNSAKLISDTDLGRAYGDMALDKQSSRLFIATGGAPLKQEAASKLRTQFDADILSATVQQNQVLLKGPILISELAKKDRYVSGVAVGPDGALFAVNINTDTVYRLAPSTYQVQARRAAGYGAYRAAVSPDGSTLAVANWGDRSIDLFATTNLERMAHIQVGEHPNDLSFGPDGRLFVTNGSSNSVSIIQHAQVIETIKTSLSASDPIGSTPDAIAVSPDGKHVFVANADNNDIAVVDISRNGHSEIEGFIPTGWYPSALAISKDGRTLYVGVAKGLASRPNVPASSPAPRKDYGSEPRYDYVGDTLTGYVSIIDLPSQKRLRELTAQVMRNYPKQQASYRETVHSEQVRKTAFPHIRHVLYIIRENRTYDQVLGDLGKGNGDAGLTLFGEKVTPNAHKMARDWVLLDNLFVNGEVSENGHQWSDAAYATDFTSEAWLQTYSGRAEPKSTESELGADERLRSSPGGYLWDNCARHHLSFRTYGEFAYFHSGPEEGPRFVAKGLEGHANLAWLRLASSGWTDITKGRDPQLADVFIREMHEAERDGNWPTFMVMSLPEDHTHALQPGHYTPIAMVASNDQALGKIVDAVSHSRFWPETAIFVIEDDAQDGPDHVDCRRTVGLAVSPYIKRNFVDSTMYTTASMIHTMELILGLPTMTQFDKFAEPMYNSFALKPDFTAYDNMGPEVDLFAKNPAKGPGAEASKRLDLSAYDRADPDEMNRILWNALKPGTPMPAPVRSAAMLSANGSAPDQ